jgi:hypothetical protein
MLANTAETRAIAKPANTKIEGTLKVLCHSADDQGDSFGTGERIVKYLKSVSARLGGQTDSDVPPAFSHSANATGSGAGLLFRLPSKKNCGVLPPRHLT